MTLLFPERAALRWVVTALNHVLFADPHLVRPSISRPQHYPARLRKRERHLADLSAPADATLSADKLTFMQAALNQLG